MNISKAFSFVFEDKQWISKVLIGGLMVLAMFTIVLAPIVIGYFWRVVHNVIKGEGESLPKWENVGELYVKGLSVILIIILYGLIGWVLGLIRIHLIISLFRLFMTFYLPIALIHFTATGIIRDAFAIEKIFKFTISNFLNLIIVWVLGWALGVVAFSGVILFGIGIIFTTFYSLVVHAYLYGEVYRVGIKGQ